jgi:hypothetical protein
MRTARSNSIMPSHTKHKEQKTRPVSNNNRTRGALHRLTHCYKANEMPARGGALLRRPHTFRESYVTKLGNVNRFGEGVVAAVIEALEQRLERSVKLLLSTGDQQSVGNACVRRALKTNDFFTADEDTVLGLEPKRFMNQDAVKTINRKLGVTRMCHAARSLVHQDATLWFIYLHHIASVAAFAQKRGMIKAEHVRFAAACLNL